jgi:hypothetical protein
MANDAPVPLGADSLFRLTRRKTTLFVHFFPALCPTSAGPQREKVDRLELVKDFRSLRNVQLWCAQKAASYLTFWRNQRSRKDWSSLVGRKEGKES